ncbi:MAG: hypothetical protein JG769_1920 [Oscillospiraceae bacterium]|jgi:uncharacterized membrane protein|nr:hypothetical protein [Oscillospiraceae bacterium]
MDKIGIIGMPWNFYEVSLFFIFYSVIGWMIEVCYMTLELGKYPHRGFLNGPLCPIYGFGTLIVMALLSPFKDNIILLFAASMVVCTSFELFVGILLEKLFNNAWWDYSHEKFNYRGLICLKVSMLWGVGCVIVVRGFHPLLERLVDLIPRPAGTAFIVFSFAYIAFDLAVSLCTTIDLDFKRKEMDEISKTLRISSETIGMPISSKVLKTRERCGRLLEKKDEARKYIKERFRL